jgi:hypothetical protein
MAPSEELNRPAGHVSVPEHAGGCGKQHTVQLDDDGRAYIACDKCAPAIVGSPGLGFAASPGAVRLTPDEIGERELAERDGVAMQRIMTKSLTDHFVAEALSRKVKQPSLAEQLAELSPAQRAEIAGLLKGDEKPPAKPATAPAAKKPGAR